MKKKAALCLILVFTCIAAIGIFLWHWPSATMQRHVKDVISLLEKEKQETLDFLKLDSDELLEPLSLVYTAPCTLQLGKYHYQPILEFHQEESGEYLSKYGFCFDDLSAGQAVALSGELLRQISLELGLEAPKSMGGQYVYPDSSSEAIDTDSSIAQLSAEKLGRASSCIVTEVWYEEDELYFQLVFSKTTDETGNANFVYLLSYIYSPPASLHGQ